VIQYSIISTLIAIAGIGATVTLWRKSRERIAEIAGELDEAIHANQELQKELKRREQIIEQQQEVRVETEEKKREVRRHADPVDRANAAIDLMRELSGSRDSDGDGSTSA
jgi:hypothetical protein